MIQLSGDRLLANLRPEFRQAVEASAASILLKIEPATVDRLERLAKLAADEAHYAETEQAAETAFALCAELSRRAALLRN